MKKNVNWVQTAQFFLWIIVCSASIGAAAGVCVMIYKFLATIIR